MKSVLLILLSFFVAMNTLAASSFSCQTLSCVRKNIDKIDVSIVELLGKRLTYVKRAGELKKHRRSVYDPKREQKILQKVGQQATALGYPASIAVAVFQAILNQSLIYERRKNQRIR